MDRTESSETEDTAVESEGIAESGDHVPDDKITSETDQEDVKMESETDETDAEDVKMNEVETGQSEVKTEMSNDGKEEAAAAQITELEAVATAKVKEEVGAAAEGEEAVACLDANELDLLKVKLEPTQQKGDEEMVDTESEAVTAFNAPVKEEPFEEHFESDDRIENLDDVVDQVLDEQLTDAIDYLVNLPASTRSPPADDKPILEEDDASTVVANPECSELEETNVPTAAVAEVPELSTPSVGGTSMDGNEDRPKQMAAAPAKIKINLFKKAATIAPPVSPPKPASPVVVVAAADIPTETSTTVDTVGLTIVADKFEVNEPAVVVTPGPPDEAALANKPRLIGRHLTVLPPAKKGNVELSGLCSIM